MGFGGKGFSVPLNKAEGGYEFTAGFTDRTTGQAGISAVGSNVLYTQTMVDAERWMRFGFDTTQQAANDIPYWTDPTPASATGVGVFGGSYMPGGVSKLFSFDDNTAYNTADESGDFQYTAASGSFDFNCVPQVANTTLEIAIIWANRDASDNITYTFALTGQPVFYGQGSVGRTFLNRPILSAYFASQEDVNARALFAIRADNIIQIQPLTTLVNIVR